ncbi:helix-turn-helix domain-containing protein [Halobacillus locisalis]|uniref:Helix-turn-helix domain-containing protein n=1 Tax=Halobacillus locisalis TaxID=220753 RepID=A0A838CSJ2_9BACI|nr:helix-turn-helix domain-containing protein [Halobacillus locisalis]MBA2175102.1 helix-turn-helix domain-containing protein [Halobacillus locisalis]
MRRWLIKIRKEQQYTQQQIAHGAHIDRAYYAQIENGTRNPSMAVASQIASFLNINPSLFFADHLSEPFETALSNSPIVVAHCDLELRYTWVFNPHPDFKMSPIIGKRDDELDQNPGTLAMMDIKKRVIEENNTIRETISFPLSDGLIYYDVFAQPLYDSNNNIIGVATASTEFSK